MTAQQSRWRVAVVLIAVVARVVGGKEFDRLMRATMDASVKATEDEWMRQAIGLPVSEWAKPYMDGGDR